MHASAVLFPDLLLVINRLHIEKAFVVHIGFILLDDVHLVLEPFNGLLLNRHVLLTGQHLQCFDSFVFANWQISDCSEAFQTSPLANGGRDFKRCLRF